MKEHSLWKFLGTIFRLWIWLFVSLTAMVAFSTQLQNWHRYDSLTQGWALVFDLGLVLILRNLYQRHRRRKAEVFIREYVFGPSIWLHMKKLHPTLNAQAAEQIAQALRHYFLIHLHHPQTMAGMPSKVVDDLWHAFILDTQAYQRFCQKAFGHFLHHVPAASMRPGISKEAPLRHTWAHSCTLESMDPHHPCRLPLLFGLDQALGIAGGNVFHLDGTQVSAQAVGANCAGHACHSDGLKGDKPTPASNGSTAGGCGGGGGCGGCGGG